MAGHSIGDLDGHDPYELLGIARTATRAEIVAAHRRQVQLVHPDRPGGDEYETVLLHVARAVLLDPAQRAELDGRTRPAPPGPTPPARPDTPTSAWDTGAQGTSVWDDEEVLDGAHPAGHESADHWERGDHHIDEPAVHDHDGWQRADAGHHVRQPESDLWDTYRQDAAEPWYPRAPGGYEPPGPVPVVVSPWSVGALVLAVLSYPAPDILGPVAVVIGLVRWIRAHGRTDRLVATTALVVGAVQTLLLLLGLSI
jgi:hypothetical protein